MDHRRMGARRVVSAAGTAGLVYAALWGRLSSSPSGEAGAVVSSGAELAMRRRLLGEEEDNKAVDRAPETWWEAAAVAGRTAGFVYAETLGKWTIGDIAFGIKHCMRTQGNLQHEFTATNCVPLEGPGVRQELMGLIRYLRLCMFFSKKPYQVFLKFGGYEQSDVVISNLKPRVMKPAFTVVRDESARCFFLFIRGAISAKERLTAATAAEVPFHHSVVQDGRKASLVTGHAHCGMITAARWIADQVTPCLSKAIEQFPDE